MTTHSTHTDITVLSRDDVAALLPGIPAQLDLVEKTYLSMARGQVELPPKPGIHPRPDSFIHAMPAYLREGDIAALKWVSGYPANSALGLPYISGLIVVNDAESGRPIGLMDAAEITAARTAAASGACVRRWAPAGWQRAALLGCGEQGVYHARMLCDLNPAVTIRAYDPDGARARALPGTVEVMETAADALLGAEVIVTAGPIVKSPRPVITDETLGETYVLLPIDFDFYVRPEAIRAADLFAVDDIGQFQYYRAEGYFQDWPAPHCSVGDALGRAASYAKVACVNLGVGSLDAAFADCVLREAEARGAGTSIRL